MKHFHWGLVWLLLSAHVTAADDNGNGVPDEMDRSSGRAPSFGYQVSAGRYVNCAIDDEGGKCWGLAYNDGSIPLERATDVGAGWNSWCIIADDTLACEGFDLGNGSLDPPLNVSNPRYLSTNVYHSCAVADEGAVCWGGRNYYDSNYNDVVVDYGQTDIPIVGGVRTVTAYQEKVSGNGGFLEYVLVVPAGASNLRIQTSGGEFVPASDGVGDIDIYGVSYCTDSNSCAYLGGSSSDDNEELYVRDRPRAGRWVIELEFYTPVSNVDFQVTYDLPISPYRPLAISAGVFHTCALEADAIRCWGRNNEGQSAVPALVKPLAVSAGAFHTCAIYRPDSANRATCWGDNLRGATDVPLLINPIAIAAGHQHTCAIDQISTTETDTVCWGGSHDYDTNTNTSIPFEQWTPDSVANTRQYALSGPLYGNCVLGDRGVACWGSGLWRSSSNWPGWYQHLLFNPGLQFDTDGDGVSNDRGLDAFPFDSSETTDTDGDGIGNNADTDDDGDGVADVMDAFPLDSSETLDSDDDGVGNNSDEDDDNDGVPDNEDAFPLDPRESSDLDADGIGDNADDDDNGDGLPDLFAIRYPQAIDASRPGYDYDGDGVGWFAEYENGTSPVLQDTDGDSIPDGVERRLGRDPAIPDYTVSVGEIAACLTDDNGVYCWGSNLHGQLEVPLMTEPKIVTLGAYHSCALDASGVYCWGGGGNGQATVPKLNEPRSVAASGYATCALDNDGVTCWGFNGNGELNVPALQKPTAIDGGKYGFCAVDETGLVCWGFNGNGETSIDPGIYPDFFDTGLYDTCSANSDQIQCWGALGNFVPGSHVTGQIVGVSVADLNLCLIGSDSRAVCRDSARNTELLSDSAFAISSWSSRKCALGENSVSCVDLSGGEIEPGYIPFIDPDKDGVSELQGDVFPYDANETTDIDNDGVGDNADSFPNDPSETRDADGDGIGDNADTDDDNDGLSDIDEVQVYGTNPLDADSDGDSLSDGEELTLGLNPLDPNDCPEEYCPQSSILLKLIPRLLENASDAGTE